MNMKSNLAHEPQEPQGELVHFPKNNHADLNTPCDCQACRSYVEKKHISNILFGIFGKAEAINEH